MIFGYSILHSMLNDSVIDIDAEATRRVLERLHEYTELVIRPLNMRHTNIELLGVYRHRVEVRISTRSDHQVLVIAPQAELLAELFWLKTAATQQLATPRVLVHDLSATQVPFAYILVNYIGGIALAQLEQPAHQRLVARQIGRSLRRMHQCQAPGFGHPLLNGRWPQRGWRETLISWLDEAGALEFGLSVLGEEDFEHMVALTLDHPQLACPQPMVIHGAFDPQRTLVTIAEAAQLETLSPPGSIVGGDPLLDVVMALLPGYSSNLRQGFLEGYAATGTLEASQRTRLRRLGVLALLYHAAQREDEAETVGQMLRAALGFLRDEA